MIRHLKQARFLYRAYRARYRDERCELDSLLSAIKPGEVALDVGANKGSYLWWLSRAVQSGRVIAFEPQPQMADYMRRAVDDLAMSNVTIEAAAVSDAAGDLELAVPAEGASPGASVTGNNPLPESWRTIRVPSVRLDDYCRNVARVAVIKVDVEGHELAVFRGAAELLRRDCPVLVFECEQRHHPADSIDDVFRFMTEAGYAGWFIQQNKLRPLAEFRLKTHQCRDGDRYWDKKDYCNNFVFRPLPPR